MHKKTLTNYLLVSYSHLKKQNHAVIQHQENMKAKMKKDSF